MVMFSSLVAAMMPGAAAVLGSVSSLRRGQSVATSHSGISLNFEELGAGAPAAASEESGPVQDGFRGESLGMKGQGFQAGFVGSTPLGELKFPSPYNIDPMRCVSGFWHVGCVYDTQTKQQIWYKDKVVKEDRVPMTPEVCFNFCKNVSGVQFMGLRRGDECYCTPFFHNTNKGGHGECDMPCVGDTGRFCGGEKLMDVYEMHDCSNLPPVTCKKPPRLVKNAKTWPSKFYRRHNKKLATPCKNAMDGPLSSHNSLCTIECEDGFELYDNTFKCEERGDPLVYSWGQLVGTAFCKPVNCGEPPKVPNSQVQVIDVHYPRTARYTCDAGHTTHGQATDPSQFVIQCHEGGNYNKTEQCKPVTCGECPRHGGNKSSKYAFATPVGAGEKTYPQKCFYKCDLGYTLDSNPGGASTYDLGCQATGEFEEPPTCQPVSCGTPFLPPNTTLSGKFGPEDTVVYGDVVDYKCDAGFSLNTAATGPKKFDVKCEADGEFSPPKTCKLISCGAPPAVKNSFYNPSSLVFLETVTYRCKNGYTTTGKAGDSNQKTIMCGEDGQFATAAPQCIPVKCGTNPCEGPNTKPVFEDTSAEVDYESDPLDYECEPGYSTMPLDTAWAPYKGNTFSLSCKADGSFESCPACVNIDDCQFVSCGNHGSCKDSDKPTGTHLDDYSCQCDSGYETTLIASAAKAGEMTKVCTNINDCPVPLGENCGGRNALGQRRGTCQDLTNGYDCVCAAGYEIGKLASFPENKTCVPVSCGTPPAVGNATTEHSGEATFDTPAWKYTCDEGYTLDGSPTGSVSFSQRCTSVGTLTRPKACKPVACHEPPIVKHSTASPVKSELFFPDEVHFTCATGYSTDSKADGEKEFSVKCQSDGRQTDPKKCTPVECGKLPVHKHASWDEGRAFVYKEKGVITCDEGYSLDASTTSTAKSYKLACQADGTFEDSQSCTRIRCGHAPLVGNASVPDKVFYYQDKPEYTLKKGYTLNGKVNGSTSFKIECLSDGSFTATKDPKPVKCAEGFVTDENFTSCERRPCLEKAPAQKNADVYDEGEELVFNETALVKCNPGHAWDVSDRSKNEYTIGCNSKGKLVHSGKTCEAIDCAAEKHSGAAPEIENGKVTGSTLFGERMTATANVGYSLDGTATGAKSFDIFCQRDGKFGLQPFPKFQIIECEVPDYKNVDTRSKDEATFGDVVTYTCKDGFRAVAGTATFSHVSDVQTFDLKCEADGSMPADGGAPADVQCVPVGCVVEEPDPKAVIWPTLAKNEKFPVHRVHIRDGVQSYACLAGYSIDGTIDGDTEFTETCGAKGKMSEENKCEDIDYCERNFCGENGQCKDGKLTYSCDCHEGYKVDMLNGESETCVQIDECHTQSGNDNCAGEDRWGECEDLTSKYKCKCNDGYENQADQLGYDTCQPKNCDPPLNLNHTLLEGGPRKMIFKDVFKYHCEQGYTLNGKFDGEIHFNVECLADTTTTPTQECIPVDCGETAAVDFAKVDKTSLVFPESATYICDEGYTLSGTVDGGEAFAVTCGADGVISEVQKCLPVLCGQPPMVANAQAPQKELRFLEEVHYVCKNGYTTTGNATGEKGFVAECNSKGNIDGVQTCEPVRCGFIPPIKHAKYPLIDHVFPEQSKVSCNNGHTVSGHARGESTFIAKCLASGELGGLETCKPVSCGVANETATTEPAEPGVEKFFEEIATWHCKPGYSVDGSQHGAKEFQQECTADGSYGASSPDTCIDIDFCEGSPCGANGYCTDLGAGVVDPGYECDCDDGFEVVMNAKGKPTCKEDDCHGDPCGPGGTCTDLSEKASGMYSCDCNEAHRLVEEVKGQPRCESVVCGTVVEMANVQLNDQNLPDVETIAWQYPIELDPLKQLPILQALDTATYTCADGYSTDGTTHIESKFFSVKCELSGLFDPVLSREQIKPSKSYCRPIRCPRSEIPAVANSEVTDPLNKEYVFGDHVEMECDKGHTIGGELGGEKGFSLACEGNGKFDSDHPNCLPVPCDVDERDFSTASRRGKVYFGQSVHYKCDVGHYVGGAVSAETTSYTGTCGASGRLDFGANDPQCEPVSCGEPDSGPNAKLYMPGPAPKYKDLGSGFCATTTGRRPPYTYRYDVHDETKCRELCSGEATCGAYSITETNGCFLWEQVGGLTLGWGYDGAHCMVKSGAVIEMLLAKGRKLQTGVHHRRSSSHGGPANGWEPYEPGTQLIYQMSAVVVCDQGFTIGGVVGGSSHYTVTCQANGDFSDGKPVSGQCMGPTYEVRGEATDVTDESVKLKGVSIKFIRLSDNSTAGTVTTVSRGRYQIALQRGEYLMIGSKGGYVTQEKKIVVEGHVQVGQGADIALSEILGVGEYRVVLTWAKHSRDLDSYFYFDKSFSKYSWFGGKHKQGPYSGLSIDLDRDDVTSYGPETTTLKNVGNCRRTCLAKFHVDNYTPKDGDIGASEGIVKLYAGSGVVKQWDVPESAGADRGVTIFTMDTSTLPAKILDGDWTYPPFIEKSFRKTGEVDWSSSLDRRGWNKVSPGQVIEFIEASGAAALHQVQTAGYYEVQPYTIEPTDDVVDWGSDLSEGQYAGCPEGSWITGLYNIGSRFGGDKGGWLLTKAQCTSFAGIAEWGKCEDVEGFTPDKPVVECPVDSDDVPSALVGFYSAGHEIDSLEALTKAKCCQFPLDAVPVPEKDRCDSDRVCKWKATAPPYTRIFTGSKR